MTKEDDKKESVVIDALISWKDKEVFPLYDKEPEPEGLFPFSLDGGYPAGGRDDISWYMRRIIAETGLDPEKLPSGWENMIRASGGERLSNGSKIPAGTVFLGIKANKRVPNKKTPSGLKLNSVKDVADAMKADKQAEAYAKRFLHEDGLFRFWLLVRDRAFAPLPKGMRYDTPLTRLSAKPKARSVLYKVSLAPFDVIPTQTVK